MAFARQQRRSLNHKGGMSPRSPKNANSTTRWLSTSIYVILGLMVIHLMISGGDPPPPRGSVNGKTTSKNKKNNNKKESQQSDKKLPSYRKPEHANAVADIAAENTHFFDRRIDGSNDILMKQAATNPSVSKPQQQLAKPDNDQAGDSGDEANDANGGANSDEEGGVESAVGGEDQPLRNVNPDQASREEENGRGSNEDEEEYGDDIGEDDLQTNVLALKANVNSVLLNLRKAAEKYMASAAEELDTELEGHKGQISTMLKPITERYFPDDTTLKIEELAFDRITESILTSMQEQVDLYIAQSSEEMDSIVADKEEEGLDVLEISEILDGYEEDKLPELEDEITAIVNGLRDGMSYEIPEKLRDTIERVFEKLSHTDDITLKFNSYQQLTMEEPQIPVDFNEEEAGAAILAVMNESDDDGEEDVPVDTSEIMEAEAEPLDQPQAVNDNGDPDDEIDNTAEEDGQGAVSGTEEVQEAFKQDGGVEGDAEQELGGGGGNFTSTGGLPVGGQEWQDNGAEEEGQDSENAVEIGVADGEGTEEELDAGEGETVTENAGADVNEEGGNAFENTEQTSEFVGVDAGEGENVQEGEGDGSTLGADIGVGAEEESPAEQPTGGEGDLEATGEQTVEGGFQSEGAGQAGEPIEDIDQAGEVTTEGAGGSGVEGAEVGETMEGGEDRPGSEGAEGAEVGAVEDTGVGTTEGGGQTDGEGQAAEAADVVKKESSSGDDDDNVDKEEQ